MEDERLRVRRGQAAPAAREPVGVQLRRPGHGRRHRPRRGADDRREQVVVQVLADAGQVDGDLDPERASSSAGPIPERSSSFGDSIVPRAQDDLVFGTHAPRPPTSTPTQRPPSRSESRRPRVPVQHGQVRRVQHRPQERDGLALPDPSLTSQVAEADAVLLGAVVVVVERDADLLRRLDRGGVERMRLVVGRHAQRPAGAVVLGLAPAEVLRALELAEARSS